MYRDARFFKKLAPVKARACHAGEHHLPHRVQIDVACVRGNGVLALGKAAGPDGDALAGSLKAVHGVADFVNRRHADAGKIIEPHQNAGNCGVRGREIERLHHVTQQRLAGALGSQARKKALARSRLTRIHYRPLNRNHQYRAGCGFFRLQRKHNPAEHDAQNNEENKVHERPACKVQKRPAPVKDAFENTDHQRLRKTQAVAE